MSLRAWFRPPLVMWAPDSRSVFLKKSTVESKQTEIWRVPVDAGPPVKPDTGLNLDQITRFFSASPSGRDIAYIRGAATPSKQEVWVLENFLQPSK